MRITLRSPVDIVEISISHVIHIEKRYIKETLIRYRKVMCIQYHFSILNNIEDKYRIHITFHYAINPEMTSVAYKAQCGIAKSLLTYLLAVIFLHLKNSHDKLPCLRLFLDI